MMGLSDSERILMIYSAVLIQSTSVTDNQAEGIAAAYTRYSIMSAPLSMTGPKTELSLTVLQFQRRCRNCH